MNKKGRVYYNPRLKAIARILRNNSTKSEIILWQHLKGKQRGFDFHRQKPIDKFIVDFYCPELMLAIEIDGDSHVGKSVYDKLRQTSIETIGIHFIRFLDSDVKNNIEGVLLVIDEWIAEHTPSSASMTPPNPPLSRGD